MHSPVHARRTPHVIAAVTLAGFAGLVGAPAAVGASTPATADGVAAPTLRDPKVVGHECRGATGVTVVVDFRKLHNEAGKVMNKVKISCAKGAQDSGLTALLKAGFEVDPTEPFICEIDERPLPEDSVCASNGYWSYSHGERGGDWSYSGVGPGDWVPPAGSLEGWSWAPYDKEGWDLPRVTPDELFPA